MSNTIESDLEKYRNFCRIIHSSIQALQEVYIYSMLYSVYMLDTSRYVFRI